MSVVVEYPPGSVAPTGPFVPGWNVVTAVLSYGYASSTLLFYNAITGAASTAGIIWPGFAWPQHFGPPALITLQNLTGFSTGWTHIVPGRVDDGRGVSNQILYYNTSDGSGALARIDTIPNDQASDPPPGSGQHHMINSWGPKTFRPYWNLVYYDMLDNQIHFYDKTDGTMEIGHVTDNGFITTTKIPRGVFSPGWTHTCLCETGEGGKSRLFYNADTGSIASIGKDTWAGGPGTVAPGWTHLSTGFFYSAYNGAAMEVMTSRNGLVVTRNWPPGEVGSFSREWTHVVDVAGIQLFYDANTAAICLRSALDVDSP
jgi:hypothetical protein